MRPRRQRSQTGRVRGVSCWWPAAVVLAATAFAGAVSAQDLGLKPRVSLGSTDGVLGAETELPLRILVPSGAPVGKVQAEVLFPTDKLTFVRVVAASDAADDLRIESEVKPAAPDDPAGQRVLAITVTSSARPVPPDLVATLVFKVAAKADPEILAVGLRHGRLWAYPETTREITPVETFEGRVALQTPAEAVACFFYMH